MYQSAPLLMCQSTPVLMVVTAVVLCTGDVEGKKDDGSTIKINKLLTRYTKTYPFEHETFLQLVQSVMDKHLERLGKASEKAGFPELTKVTTSICIKTMLSPHEQVPLLELDHKHFIRGGKSTIFDAMALTHGAMIIQTMQKSLLPSSPY